MNPITVEVHETKYATPQERHAFIQASLQLAHELNLPSFWAEVEELWDSWTCKPRVQNYDGSYYTMGFESFKRMILRGADKFNTEEDGDIDIRVEFYYSFRNVVGYTKPTTWWTWINRNLFKNFDVGDIAGNQGHEYLHNCGLDHPGTDRQSVVYQFGYLIRDRIKKRLDLELGSHTYGRSWWSRIKTFFGRIF